MTWEKSDNSRFRDYLKKSQSKLIGYLKTRTPRISGATIEAVALEAKFKEGYEHALRELEDLALVPENEDDPSTGTFTTM